MSIQAISETELLGGAKRRIRFSITGAHKASLAGEALRNLAKDSGINPQANNLLSLLYAKHGAKAVDARMLSYVATRCALPYVREHNLPILFNPEPARETVDGMTDKTDLEFDVDVYVRPEYELSSYEPVYLHRPDATVTDEQVNAQIIREMNRFATFEDSDEPAAEGDCLQVNMSTLVNGAPDMGLSGDAIAIILSSDVMPKGFVNEVVGMAKGDKKEFSFDNLEKGNIVHYRCSVELLDKKVRVVPELTDEFVRTQLSQDDKTVEEFRARVRDYVAKREGEGDPGQLEALADTQLGERLRGAIPDELIERTTRDMMDSIRQNAEASGMTLEEFAKLQGGTSQEFQTNVMMQARESLRQGLALDAVFKHYNMTITDADEKAALTELAPGNEEAARRSLADNDAWYLVINMAMRLKAHNWVMQTAVIE